MPFAKPPKENEPGFACLLCGKVFCERKRLRTHSKNHSASKAYHCPHCKKCFARRGNLNTHLRTHSGEKPEKCEMCGRAFSHRGSLIRHLKTHSGEKMFDCNFESCDKSFLQRSNLTAHLRVHTGEKPYKCCICGKGFAQKGNLKYHENTHTTNRSVHRKKRHLSKTVKTEPSRRDSLDNLSSAELSDHSDPGTPPMGSLDEVCPPSMIDSRRLIHSFLDEKPDLSDDSETFDGLDSSVLSRIDSISTNSISDVVSSTTSDVDSSSSHELDLRYFGEFGNLTDDCCGEYDSFHCESSNHSISDVLVNSLSPPSSPSAACNDPASSFSSSSSSPSSLSSPPSSSSSPSSSSWDHRSSPIEDSEFPFCQSSQFSAESSVSSDSRTLPVSCLEHIFHPSISSDHESDECPDVSPTKWISRKKRCLPSFKTESPPNLRKMRSESKLSILCEHRGEMEDDESETAFFPSSPSSPATSDLSEPRFIGSDSVSSSSSSLGHFLNSNDFKFVLSENSSSTPSSEPSRSSSQHSRRDDDSSSFDTNCLPPLVCSPSSFASIHRMVDDIESLEPVESRLHPSHSSVDDLQHCFEPICSIMPLELPESLSNNGNSTEKLVPEKLLSQNRSVYARKLDVTPRAPFLNVAQRSASPCIPGPPEDPPDNPSDDPSDDNLFKLEPFANTDPSRPASRSSSPSSLPSPSLPSPSLPCRSLPSPSLKCPSLPSPLLPPSSPSTTNNTFSDVSDYFLPSVVVPPPSLSSLSLSSSSSSSSSLVTSSSSSSPSATPTAASSYLLPSHMPPPTPPSISDIMMMEPRLQPSPHHQSSHQSSLPHHQSALPHHQPSHQSSLPHHPHHQSCSFDSAFTLTNANGPTMITLPLRA